MEHDMSRRNVQQRLQYSEQLHARHLAGKTSKVDLKAASDIIGLLKKDGRVDLFPGSSSEVSPQ